MFGEIILTFSITLFLISTVQTIVVRTENGLIEGLTQVINGKEVTSFIGIPFAKPPVKELRFKKPEPIKSEFNGIYRATEIKPQCVSPFNTSANMDEDCLYLNVWTPKRSSTGTLNDSFPVMFWIYGGSFFMGSATKIVDGYNIFNGTQLALRDVVVVTANYRLGVFGYLFGDSVDAPGNMGHWDQYQALMWTQQNIKIFGGNPNDITLFGVSAGSIAISHHIISPISRHLFSKAIMQSGSVDFKNSWLKSTELARINSRNFSRNPLYFPIKPCVNDSDWVQCLKEKSTSDLNSAQTLFFYDNFLSLTPFKPVFGDEFLPKTALQAFKETEYKTDVKLFLGHSLMEGVSFARDTDLAIDMDGRYNPEELTMVTKDVIFNDIRRFIPNGSLTEDTVNSIASAYTKGFPEGQANSQTSKSLLQSAAHAYGDVAITCPTILFGSELVKQKTFMGTVFQYRLTYANSKSISYNSYWAEAEHTDEQPLVFGRPLNEPLNNWTTNDIKMSKTIVTIWTDFAKNGKPTLFDGNEWPEYSVKINGSVNISYVDLNPFLNNNSQEIQINCYRGMDGFYPNVINNCLEFWSDILIEKNYSINLHNTHQWIPIILYSILFKILHNFSEH